MRSVGWPSRNPRDAPDRRWVGNLEFVWRLIAYEIDTSLTMPELAGHWALVGKQEVTRDGLPPGLERRRPRHTHPERSQSGLREAAIARSSGRILAVLVRTSGRRLSVHCVRAVSQNRAELCEMTFLHRRRLLPASVPSSRRVIHLEFTADELPAGITWRDRA